MANSKGPSSMRSMVYHGKSSLLPPKSPFPSISSLYGDYAPRSAVPQRGTTKARDGNSLHQRTSSESCLIEEQPSWLDDLLNEPETPVRRGGHRRSSSDSFAYSDAASLENFDDIAQDDNNFRNITPVASWGSQDFDYYVDARHATSYVGQNSLSRNKNRARDACSTVSHSRDLPSSREHFTKQSTGSSCPPQERDRPKSAGSEKQYLAESGTPDPKGSVEEIDSSRSKASASESDTKRAKQQFAQRSRVRKLQYIAELERNVQALQAEGSEVSAELEFLNQQTLILSMENKALKQRLENLAQEKLIKYLEHEVLERERARLRALYQQQQQQPQQPCSNHRRSTSKDLDQQFASLSLKYEASSARDPVPGQLHI